VADIENSLATSEFWTELCEKITPRQREVVGRLIANDFDTMKTAEEFDCRKQNVNLMWHKVLKIARTMDDPSL
jgi:hypothetical protein